VHLPGTACPDRKMTDALTDSTAPIPLVGVEIFDESKMQLVRITV
jgi:hypothetical protein